MKIALDSNVFMDDFRMQKTHFELLRRYLQFVPDTELVTCQITVDDVLTQFHERLKFENTRAVRGAINCDELTGRASEWLKPEHLEEETEKFKIFFENALSTLPVSIIDYKDLTLSHIIKRSFERHNILTNQDFKVLFNWEAMHQNLLEPGVQLVAITDQAHKLIVSGTPTLFFSDYFNCDEHNRYIQHIQPNLPDWRKVELFPTLQDFLHKQLNPHLQLKYDKLDLLSNTQQADDINTVLDNWLKHNTHQLVVELERQLPKIFLPSNIKPHQHTLRVHAMGGKPSGYTYMDVFSLDERTLYWPIRIKLYIVMSFDADPGAELIAKRIDRTESRLIDQTSSSSANHIFAKLELPIQISIIWDIIDKTATHEQITFLPIQRWCETCGEPFIDLTPSTCPVCQTVWP